MIFSINKQRLRWALSLNQIIPANPWFVVINCRDNFIKQENNYFKLLRKVHLLIDFLYFFTTDRVKLSNRPETLDFFNLYEVFRKKGVSFFLQYFIAYSEFRVADKVL